MSNGSPEIVAEKDGEGYLAHVKGSENLYAYGLTREQALQELSGVIGMTEDFRLTRAMVVA
jgi:predicted RNase H-like HicB family nuclease